SLTYGKQFLEEKVYDGQPRVLAFRPGGWDHGSTAQDTDIYFRALRDSGIAANSGLSVGTFKTARWSIGNSPGHNLARVKVEDNSIVEVSPTSGPGGYINPALDSDLGKLAGRPGDEIRVIVSVYHVGSLQRYQIEEAGSGERDPESYEAKVKKEHQALERHL